MPKFKKKPEGFGRGEWDGDNMTSAVKNVIDRKMTIREAARNFSVPKSTLQRRINKIKTGVEVTMHPDLGRFKPTFESKYEDELVRHIKDMDARLMPFTRKEFMKLAYDLATKMKIDHRFNQQNKMAGKDFYYNFMKKHPDLSLRQPQSTSLMRTVALRWRDFILICLL